MFLTPECKRKSQQKKKWEGLAWTSDLEEFEAACSGSHLTGKTYSNPVNLVKTGNFHRGYCRACLEAKVILAVELCRKVPGRLYRRETNLPSSTTISGGEVVIGLFEDPVCFSESHNGHWRLRPASNCARRDLGQRTFSGEFSFMENVPRTSPLTCVW